MTIIMMKSIVLPDAQVRDYVQQQLSRGDKLSRFVAQSVEPSPGGFVFLPPNIVGLLGELGRGLANPTYTKLARERLVEFIADYLVTDQGAIAVFEGDAIGMDDHPKSAAKFITNVPSDTAIWRAPDFKRPSSAQSIYYVADSSSRSADEIRGVLRSARGYPRIGVLTVFNGPTAAHGAEISDPSLHELARRAHYLVLGAFDEEVDLIIPTRGPGI